MPHQTLRAENTATDEHANVAHGSQQSYRTKEEIHPGGNSSFQPSRVMRRLEPIGHDDSADRQCSQKSDPVKNARFAFSAPDGHP